MADDTAPERRVVLLKPGDVLLIGRCDVLDVQDAERLGAALDKLGIKAVVFSDDIVIDSATADAVARYGRTRQEVERP